MRGFRNCVAVGQRVGLRMTLTRHNFNDLDRIFAELRLSESQHPGPLIRSPEELRRYVAEQQHRHEAADSLILKERLPES